MSTFFDPSLSLFTQHVSHKDSQTVVKSSCLLQNLCLSQSDDFLFCKTSQHPQLFVESRRCILKLVCDFCPVCLFPSLSSLSLSRSISLYPSPLASFPTFVMSPIDWGLDPSRFLCVAPPSRNYSRSEVGRSGTHGYPGIRIGMQSCSFKEAVSEALGFMIS